MGIVLFLFGGINQASFAAEGDTIIYGANRDDNTIIEINLTQGTAQPVGTLAFGTLAMDQDPTTGYVYYFERLNTGNQFAYWNPADGTNTIVRTYNPAPGFSVDRMAFRGDGALFIMDSDRRIYRINKTNGDITTAGRVSGPLPGTGDLVFTPIGATYVTASRNLYTISPDLQSTLLYSNMIPNNADIVTWTGLVYCNGLLYASHVETDGQSYALSAMYSIDPTSGEVNKLFNLPTYVGDLTSCSAYIPFSNSPTAYNQAVTTDEETPVSITLTASDTDQDALTYNTVSKPSHGALSGSAPNLTYTPKAGYRGPDRFTFKANNGTDNSNMATVSIIVNPASDSSDTILYGGNRDTAEIVEINLTQGTAQVVGTMAFGTTAMERDPDTGYIYYFEEDVTGHRFAYWNPATGTNTIVRTYNPAPGIYVKRMAFRADGTLYMMDDQDRVHTINKLNGDITTLSKINGLVTGSLNGTGDMAFTPNGTAYIVTYDNLYSVQYPNSTLLYSNMLDIDADIVTWSGLAYCNETFYASHVESNEAQTVASSAMYTINPNTGQVTKLFDLPIYINDLTSCSTDGSTSTPPVANNQSKSTTVNTPVAITLTASDADSDPLTSSTAISNSVKMVGFGIMGCSDWDEYQADDNRGGRYADTTLNGMEQLVLSRQLNFGPWGDWGEPRRSGYKYNWARSGATARSLIKSGQHTGLAQQVANGEVSHVFLYIGQNDFSATNGTYAEIYSGELSGAALQAKLDGVVANITMAVDTILAEKQVPMVVVTIPDPGKLPFGMAKFSDPVKQQRVTRSIDSVNAELEAMAKARSIQIASIQPVYASLLDRADKNGFVDIGGELINALAKGNEPHYARLDDTSGHAGTVAAGLLANLLFIEPFNHKYGLNITPLSDKEILENAGIIVP